METRSSDSVCAASSISCQTSARCDRQSVPFRLKAKLTGYLRGASERASTLLTFPYHSSPFLAYALFCTLCRPRGGGVQ